MQFSVRNLFSLVSIAARFILSSTGCNNSGDQTQQTQENQVKETQLYGAWTGYTVDQNASDLEKTMQAGVQENAMKVQFDQQQVTLTQGQYQPQRGNWKVLSKDEQSMKIAIDLQAADTPSFEFDIQFLDQDRITMRRLDERDEHPQTFTRIR